MKKLLSRKTKLFIISVLMPVSMMSVGFSSWVFGATTTQSADVGSFATESVINQGDFVSINVDFFEYISTGFFTATTDESGKQTFTVGDEGYITAHVTMDLTKCREVFVAGTSLQLQVELFNNQTVKENGELVSLFPYFDTATYVKGTNTQNTKVCETISHSAEKVTATVALGALSSTATTLSCTVRFKFDVARVEGKSFADVYDILQTMESNNVSLILKAKVTQTTGV